MSATDGGRTGKREAREITLVFPHQLFEHHPALQRERLVILVEDSLFFGDPSYPLRFHKHKLLLHFATMEHYAATLRTRGYAVRTVCYRRGLTFPRVAETELAGVREIHLCDVTDDVLQRRIVRAARTIGSTVHWYESPGFLSPQDWLQDQLTGHNRARDEAGPRPPRLQQFYIAQRRRMGILLAPESPNSPGSRGEPGPIGGRWSFDSQNRKPWPARTPPPPEPVARYDTAAASLLAAAAKRVNREFARNPGTTDSFWYPVTHQGARDGLHCFLQQRLPLFGPYEDAIASNGTVLYHSVLTPMLNIGLLTPQQVLDALDQLHPLSSAAAGRDSTIPTDLLPGIEGFVRQVIGWREYIRGVYLYYGVRQRTGNFWRHQLPMPGSFYRGDTGILPLDTVIQRVLDRSYCHHIERLMILGNMMLLCEIEPDEVYRWFMELFVDAYDWVMVPNVYGMSQFADGGLLATKPYISGANYIRKMSDYPRGQWEETWTALFWRFLHRHRSYFAEQPRMGMLVRRLDREPNQTAVHRERAERFLQRLHGDSPGQVPPSRL